MKRILEPELMQDQNRVKAYADANFSDSIGDFVKGFLNEYGYHSFEYVLDIGCGPADIPLELVKKTNSRVIALDGSQEMLNVAQSRIETAGEDYGKKIILENALIQEYVPEEKFGAIISKDLIHHLEDPFVLWDFIKEYAKKGTVVYHMDLIKAPTKTYARELVEKVAGNEHPLLKEDFYNSLLAAFTIKEVKKQIAYAGLNLSVEPAKSGRHYIVHGKIE